MLFMRRTDTRSLRPRTSVPLAMAVLVVAAACQGAPAATSSPTATDGQASASAPMSASASAATSASASPSASEMAAGDCLDPPVVAALDEIDSGRFETDPDPGEVADALEALPLDGAAAKARDSLVTALRKEPLDGTAIVIAATRLKAQVALPEC